MDICWSILINIVYKYKPFKYIKEPEWLRHDFASFKKKIQVLQMGILLKK